MLQGKDIIIVGQQPWDVEIGSNCKNIALELSKYNRVLYVNAPLDRITKIRLGKNPKIKKRINIIKNREKGLEEVRKNLWVLYPDVLIESINWIRINILFSIMNRVNNKRFSKAIKRAITNLEFSSYLLFNDSDIFRSFYLKDLLRPDLSIYYIRDNIVATPYWRRHGRLLEPKLIKKSDLVLTNSEYLRTYSAKYNTNSFFVAQGCDFEIFRNSDLSTPKDVVDIPNPIIGYFGVLTTMRLDIRLIQHIADSLSNYSIVLIGPEDDTFKNSNLHSCENVHFLGIKAPEDIFTYINTFDVCINPQVLNELTVGNYPRKIDEYLALGKPVVATWTETMQTFEKYVYLANGYKSFVDLIKIALEEDSAKERRRREKFALSHNWENAVNNISRRIKTYLLNENRTFNNGL